MRPFTCKVSESIRSLEGEIWVELNYNGQIIPRYRISNFGRIYDIYTKSLMQYSMDKDGYYMVSLIIGPRIYKKARVHRVELLSFNFNPDFENLQCNHKNGNKQDLSLNNLEWVSPLYNTRHGWDTGLNHNFGINNGNGKYTEADIHRICRYIDDGYTNARICTEFGITDKRERMIFNGTISGIRYGKTHRDISYGYKFMQGVNISNRYSLEFAELVCQFLSDKERDYSYKDIMDALNIPNEERINFKIFIDDLVRGRTAKNITQKYKLKSPIQDKDIYSYLMR